MRTISQEQIIDIVKKLCIEANHSAPDDLIQKMEAACDLEKSPTGRKTISLLLKNYKTAKHEHLPICQDTGLAVFMVDIGNEIFINGSLEEAINEGVRRGYEEGYLRKSVVKHPIDRINTKDNTPAIIHYRLITGDKIKITIMPKGGGSENASALQMLKPSDGANGVIDFVTERVRDVGVNGCPPLIIGVGIGGNFEGCAILAKHAILQKKTGYNECDIDIANKIYRQVNNLGIGPAGFGGTVTALEVKVASKPCHIASLPCAVNIQCNAHRVKEVFI